MRPDERLGPKFVVYHDVVAAAGGDEGLARARFRRHISAIAESGHRFAKMSDFLDGAPLGKRDVILTVDDGAASFLSCVLPVLREFGATATLFVVSGLLDLRDEGVRFLTWDDVSRLVAEGFDIGSHGVSHVPLDEVDPERMRREVFDATEAMRAHDLAPRTFAYPFGRFDEGTKRTVAEAGYEAAFTVMKGGYDTFEVRRRLFTGLEGPMLTRFIMGDHFFEIREAARKLVPRRFLKQELPIAPERWGLEHLRGES